MEEGWIGAASFIGWSEKKEWNWWGKAIVGSSLSGTAVPAHRCPRCKIVIFSYEKA